ncbi:beta-lactamase-like protein [Epithele typhae]|uniref:beta-lactamase-like protein n=1 Tax=Epithele typhae TaxID=378194 RepID=UPI0020074E00|nr:beta-lactamase-like protein [Epithele typhae]KAH9940439.1 beta-lactamase-like protein [Epithele typhae]
MSFPPPGPNQGYCELSALDAGQIYMSLLQLIDTAAPDDVADLPVLAFLLKHVPSGTYILFDLGIRPDVAALPIGLRTFCDSIQCKFTGVDIPAALRRGGLDPGAVQHIVLSHVHFDHAGDTTRFPNATIHLGGAAVPLLAELAAKGPGEATFVACDLPPAPRTNLLPQGEGEGGTWAPLGPFPRAHDLLGDGSVYVVDAPGHVPGHVALVARTSADGAWAFLAGDSAHDWRIVTGEAGIGHHPALPCMHADEAASNANIARIRTLTKMERVRVLLAHDLPFVRKEKETGMKSYWPGKIESL